MNRFYLYLLLDSATISIANYGAAMKGLLLWFAECADSFGKRLMLPFRFPTARFERGVKIKGSLRRLKLDKDVVVQSGTVLHLGGKPWCGGEGGIEIGRGSVISPNCVLYGTGGRIRIGDNFDCGPFVGIYASRTDYQRLSGHVFADVTIGDDVVVFSHVVIGPGVRIGSRAVVAAGSVVLSDVPEGCFVAGTPARAMRRRSFGKGSFA